MSDTTTHQNKPITIGLTLIGGGHWTGGETYLRNMLGAIHTFLPGKLNAKLFLSPAQAEQIGSSLDAFLESKPIIDEKFDWARRNRQLAGSLLTGANSELARIYQDHDIDLVWESAVFLGRRFPIPVLSWLPDFQHQHLKTLFSKPAWWRREIGFRMQTGSARTVVLSSHDARKDCEQFYPKSKGKTCVVNFAIDLDPAAHINRQQEILATYNLPARYIYLPNQFWSHKNHRLIIEALTLLKERNQLADALPIVMTGNKKDPRDPTLFDRLIAEATERNLIEKFRYLGMVPYEDVFGLNAASDAFVNPSHFEGWSTTVEEAKALGSRLLLSDIGVHREQAPHATFFKTDDAHALAVIMNDLAHEGAFERASIKTLQSDHHQRLKNYSEALLLACQSAVARGAPG